MMTNRATWNYNDKDNNIVFSILLQHSIAKLF